MITQEQGNWLARNARMSERERHYQATTGIRSKNLLGLICGKMWRDKSEVDCDRFMAEAVIFRSLGRLKRSMRIWSHENAIV